MVTKLGKIVAVLGILTLLVSNGAAVQASLPEAPSGQAREITVTQTFIGETLKNAIRTPDGLVKVIVQLTDPPLALYRGGIGNLAPTHPGLVGDRKLNLDSPASQAYLSHLAGVQNQFTAALQSQIPAAQPVTQYQIAFNGVALAVPEADLSTLASMPGVQHVYPDQMRTIELDASLALINAPEMWTMLGGQPEAGAGIKVAVVDTGLSISNPMFAGTGFTMPPGYPKGYCATNPDDPDFQCNAKVIAARYFFDPTIAPVHADEVQSPLDINGHGSHTAGTAAGNPVTVPGFGLNISGVAPAAHLMVYKALFTTEDGSTATGNDSMLSAALEAALADGADVINNSWGGGPGADPRASVYGPVLEAITEAGTLVVFSAGNSGPGAGNQGTIGCPGCVEQALTVAASTTSRTFTTTIGAVSVSGGAVPIPPEVTSITGRSVATTPVEAETVDLEVIGYADPLACSPLPAGQFTGQIVVVQRGTCVLVDKVANAAAGGAVGVVIRNIPGGANTLPLIQGVLPTVHVDLDAGEAIRTFLVDVNEAGATATFRINAPATAVTTDAQDVLAAFSSSGPNADTSFLKPEITAPGVNILSATSPALGGFNFDFFSGTSMAAPHATGAAALVMQQHPEWSPGQVKSALTTTAVQEVFQADGTTPATAFNMGAGRLDLSRASQAGLTFERSNFSSGNCLLTCTWTSTIRNETGSTLTLNAVVTSQAGMSLSVEPASFTLPPGLSGEFSVSADSRQIPANSYSFGSIVWRDSAGTIPDAYMPVTVRAGASTDASLVTKSAAPVAAWNDPLTYTIELVNIFPETTTFFINDPLPVDTQFVEGSASPGLTYDPATHSVTGEVTLQGMTFGITATGATMYEDAPADAIDLTAGCLGSGCDDAGFNLTGMDYFYMGKHYTSIGVTTNGTLVVGGLASVGEITPSDQIFPNPAIPNNVIAPLWTDLDLDDPLLPDDTGGGQLLVWGTDTHTVFEWLNAQQFGDPMAVYSFQVWIEDGTDNITFAYGELPDLGAYDLSIGAENETGSLGVTYLSIRDGVPTGTLPEVGSDLSIDQSAASFSGSFQVTLVPETVGSFNVVNTLEVLNNQNARVDLATATTSVQAFTLRLPIIFR